VIAAVDAPQQARRAIVLLWLSALLGAGESTYVLFNPDPEIAEFAGLLFGVALAFTAAYGLVIYLASRRYNWARYVLLVWIAAGIGLYLVLLSEQWEPWWDVAMIAVSTVIETIALYWLFTGTGAQWYRQRIAE
jgi:hypothetical protein